MRIVHLADLHLGRRQFDRESSFGVNQREADLEKSFSNAVDRVIALQPDAVVIAGDIFHSPRPVNRSSVFAVEEFHRLLRGLKGAPVVACLGNHDLLKTSERATVAGVLKVIGVHVAEWEAQRFAFPELGLSILAVPESMAQRPALVPDPAFQWNVLLLHGEVAGMPRVKGDRTDVEIATDELNLPAWDRVCLGHYHVCHEIAPNCWYSGAIDYTSSNPWGERQDEQKFGLSGKGFLEHDLAAGTHTFHPLPLTRDHIDETLSAHGLTPAELTVAIAEKLDDMHPDMAIARLIITDCPRNVWREVDQKVIKPFKLRALNLQVVPRAPEVVTVGSRVIRTARRVPLEEQFADFLRRRELPADISLEAITKLGLSYLPKGQDQDFVPELEASITAGAA